MYALKIYIYFFTAVLDLCCYMSYSLVAASRFLIEVVSLVAKPTLDTWASLIAACGLRRLRHRSLVVPRHLGSFCTRDQTHVSCIGRQVLNHCATREALYALLNHEKAELRVVM